MKNNNFKIDFIGAGFSRCGTTWLYSCLKEHSKVCVSSVKETDFFKKEEAENNLNHYSIFFNHCKKEQIKGEINPSYATNQETLERVKRIYPNIKLIFIIRNPIKRALSTYLYGNKYSNKVAIINEDEFKKEWEDREQYYKYLKKWYKNFPKENIYIMTLDEIEKTPKQSLQKLYSFLEVDDSFVPSNINEKENKAHIYYFPKTHKFLTKCYKKIKNTPLLLKFTNLLFLNKLKNKISEANRKEIEKPEISKKTRNYLKKQFRDEVIKLEKLTGKDLSLWK